MDWACRVQQQGEELVVLVVLCCLVFVVGEIWSSKQREVMQEAAVSWEAKGPSRWCEAGRGVVIARRERAAR